MARPAPDLHRARSSSTLRRMLLDRPLLTVSGLLVVVSLTFLAAPQLDLAFSRLLYDPETGFGGAYVPLLFSVRRSGRLVEWLVALAFVAPLAVKLLAPQSRLLLRPRTTAFALAAFALGPGLIVNGITKRLWGRARPEDLLEFGGDLTFTPAWWLSDQCDRNCSFVSGEGASAFWLVAIAFVVPKPWRPAAAIVTLTAAAVISFSRIATGGHFLSDVLIAWLLTLLVMVALQKLILRGLPPQFDDAIEAGIAACGRAPRRLLAALAGRIPG